MSGAPKRMQEEVGHSSSSKDIGVSPTLTSPGVSNEYHHAPHKMGQDARVKIPWSESQDLDRRSPLHSMYWLPSSMFHDSHVESLPPTSESRLELRDSRENPRVESRELYSETNRDAQSVKGEKDARYDSRGYDNKEVKYDKDNYSELKGDVQLEKDVHGAAGVLLIIANAFWQQRFVREVIIQYNLCNEPWIKYSISIVAYKGLKKPLYTSACLKKGDVLYLETHSCRYELCSTKAMPVVQSRDAVTEKSQNHQSHSTNGEKSDGDSIVIDVFRCSHCEKPLLQNFMRSIGIPLPPDHLEKSMCTELTFYPGQLDWEDVQWSQTGVWIAGKEYSLARVHFRSKD